MSRNNAGLNTEGIVIEALRIIDGQGLRRLTMRRLGDALGVEAMAIYHHFPLGKEQLFDAIVAHITDVTTPSPPSQSESCDDDKTDEADSAAEQGEQADPRPWNQRLHDWAGAYRTALLTHAGALALLINRRPDTPAALRSLESHYAAFTEAGLPRAEVGAAAVALDSYVTGAVLHEVRAQSPPSPDGISNLALDGRYPHLAGIIRDFPANDSPEGHFHTGLDALLAGLVGDNHQPQTKACAPGYPT